MHRILLYCIVFYCIVHVAVLGLLIHALRELRTEILAVLRV
jgi:hypothetical protein